MGQFLEYLQLVFTFLVFSELEADADNIFVGVYDILGQFIFFGYLNSQLMRLQEPGEGRIKIRTLFKIFSLTFILLDLERTFLEEGPLVSDFHQLYLALGDAESLL